MDDIITQILDIDKKARDKLARAYEEKKQIIIDAEEEREKIKTELLERADHRLELVEAEEKKNADERLCELEKQTKEKIESLDKSFKDNREQWEKDIFNKIIAL